MLHSRPPRPRHLRLVTFWESFDLPGPIWIIWAWSGNDFRVVDWFKRPLCWWVFRQSHTIFFTVHSQRIISFFITFSHGWTSLLASSITVSFQFHYSVIVAVFQKKTAMPDCWGIDSVDLIERTNKIIDREKSRCAYGIRRSVASFKLRWFTKISVDLASLQERFVRSSLLLWLVMKHMAITICHQLLNLYELCLARWTHQLQPINRT